MKQPESSPTLRFASLDGLRGLAVLFVLFSHMSNAGLNFHAGLNFSGSGKYGVFCFFVLSAFLLSAQILALPVRQAFSRPVLTRYIVRRFFRIYPLYTFVLCLGAIWTALKPNPFIFPLSWPDVYRHLALLDGQGVYWTIPVEFKYYFALPLVCWILARSRSRQPLLAPLLTAGAVLLVAWLWPSGESQINSFELGPYLSIFFLGSFTALVHFWLGQLRRSSQTAIPWAFEVMALLTFGLIITTIPSLCSLVLGRPVASDYFHRSYLLYGALWSIFLLSQLHGHGFFRRLLSWSPLRFIGRISFSVYLWHPPIVAYFQAQASQSVEVRALLVLLVSLSVSTVSYGLIERPFLKLWSNQARKQLSGKPDSARLGAGVG